MISRDSSVDASNGLIFHDFVPFNICQVLVEPFLGFFLKILKKLDVENFWPVAIILRKSKKSKKYFFLQKIVLFLVESQLYMILAFF
jgi:hypothetical protein